MSESDYIALADEADRAGVVGYGAAIRDLQERLGRARRNMESAHLEIVGYRNTQAAADRERDEALAQLDAAVGFRKEAETRANVAEIERDEALKALREIASMERIYDPEWSQNIARDILAKLEPKP